MSGYYGPPIVLPRCKHGAQAYEVCYDCRDERERERRAEEARSTEAFRPYHDMIANHRRWFDDCAFCPRDALVIRTRHEQDCPFRNALIRATAKYAVHLLKSVDPAADDPCSTGPEGNDG